MPSILIDNDILAKCAIYSLMSEMVATLNVERSDVGVLGSARFVLSPKRLRTAADGQANAHRRLTEFLDNVHSLEPNPDETALAAELEERAIQAEVQLDAGESQLCAIALTRVAKWLCTGDKRAILALEQLRDLLPKLKELDRKLICLEALINAMNTSYGHGHVRDRVCSCQGTDKTLDICFQCHNAAVDASEVNEGIRSYLNALVKHAPNLSSSF
jgi:hypothetical protein